MNNRLGYICGTTSWGGLEMNQLRNAMWMQERGYLVAVICIKESPIALNALEANLPVLYIEKHKKYYDFSKGSKLVQVLKVNQISHLIVRATQDMSISAFAKRRLGKGLHLSYFMEMQLGVKKTNILHTIRFRHFDLWSCPLNWLAEQVQTMTHFTKELIVVIPSGLDLRQFENIPSKLDSRDQLNLPKDIVLFGLIGRFDAHKGQLLLLKAMQLCKDKSFGLAFLGEPTRNESSTYFDQMTQFIAEHNLQDRVFIRPFRKDIGVFYSSIDWFVMASKAETFGMVTIEAMACGTPTLGSNAGGTPEILKFGELGVLFKSLDAIDLAQRIDSILEGNHSIESRELIDEAKKYDHVSICIQVEKALGL